MEEENKDYVPGCESYTKASEISSLQKYLKAGIAQIEDNLILDDTKLKAPKIDDPTTPKIDDLPEDRLEISNLNEVENLPDTRLDLEDKEVSLPDTRLDLEDKEVSLPDTRLDIEDKEVSLPDTRLDIEDKEVSLPDTRLDIEDKEVSLPDTRLDIEDKEVSLPDTRLDIKEKDVSLREKKLNIKSPYKNSPDSLETYRDDLKNLDDVEDLGDTKLKINDDFELEDLPSDSERITDTVELDKLDNSFESISDSRETELSEYRDDIISDKSISLIDFLETINDTSQYDLEDTVEEIDVDKDVRSLRETTEKIDISEVQVSLPDDSVKLPDHTNPSETSDKTWRHKTVSSLSDDFIELPESKDFNDSNYVSDENLVNLPNKKVIVPTYTSPKNTDNSKWEHLDESSEINKEFSEKIKDETDIELVKDYIKRPDYLESKTTGSGWSRRNEEDEINSDYSAEIVPNSNPTYINVEEDRKALDKKVSSYEESSVEEITDTLEETLKKKIEEGKPTELDGSDPTDLESLLSLLEAEKTPQDYSMESIEDKFSKPVKEEVQGSESYIPKDLETTVVLGPKSKAKEPDIKEHFYGHEVNFKEKIPEQLPPVDIESHFNEHDSVYKEKRPGEDIDIESHFNEHDSVYKEKRPGEDIDIESHFNEHDSVYKEKRPGEDIDIESHFNEHDSVYKEKRPGEDIDIESHFNEHDSVYKEDTPSERNPHLISEEDPHWKKANVTLETLLEDMLPYMEPSHTSNPNWKHLDPEITRETRDTEEFKVEMGQDDHIEPTFVDETEPGDLMEYGNKTNIPEHLAPYVPTKNPNNTRVQEYVDKESEESVKGHWEKHEDFPEYMGSYKDPKHTSDPNWKHKDLTNPDDYLEATTHKEIIHNDIDIEEHLNSHEFVYKETRPEEKQEIKDLSSRVEDSSGIKSSKKQGIPGYKMSGSWTSYLSANPAKILRWTVENTVGKIPLHGSAKQALLDETLSALEIAQEKLEKTTKLNKYRLPGGEGGAVSSIANLAENTVSGGLSLKNITSTGTKIASALMGTSSTEVKNPINYPRIIKDQNGNTTVHSLNIFESKDGQNSADSGKDFGSIDNSKASTLLGKNTNLSYYRPSYLINPYYYNLKNSGLKTTIEDLTTIKKTGDYVNLSFDELKEYLTDDLGYMTTANKVIGKTKGGHRHESVMTLDENSCWEIILEPYTGIENGFVSFLPSIQEINYENYYKFGLNTNWYKWIPFTSFELNSKKMMQKGIPLFGGEMSIPNNMEYTNELRLVICDDQYKSWKRYFDNVMFASVYDSQVRGQDYYKKEFIQSNARTSKTFTESDLTSFDRSRVRPSNYKNLVFRCRIYVMNLQYQTINKSDLLIILKDFTEEWQGETDASPVELSLSFSVVGENPRGDGSDLWKTKFKGVDIAKSEIETNLNGHIDNLQVDYIKKTIKGRDYFETYHGCWGMTIDNNGNYVSSGLWYGTPASKAEYGSVIQSGLTTKEIDKIDEYYQKNHKFSKEILALAESHKTWS